MVENIKERIGSLVIGDTFALPIKSEKYPEYNGRYLLLIKGQTPWKVKRTETIFRLKITEGKKIPTTFEEMNALNYVKFDFRWYPEKIKRHAKQLEGVEIDEYCFAYTYCLSVVSPRYKVPKDLVYLGNYKFDLPKDEYITTYDENISFWDLIVENTLRRYEYFNLRKMEIFSREGYQKFLERKMSRPSLEDLVEQAMKEINSPGYVSPFKDDGKRHRGSLTYVGPEEDREKYGEKKRKK